MKRSLALSGSKLPFGIGGFSGWEFDGLFGVPDLVH
jgi:hypothetical protein